MSTLFCIIKFKKHSINPFVSFDLLNDNMSVLFKNTATAEERKCMKLHRERKKKSISKTEIHKIQKEKHYGCKQLFHYRCPCRHMPSIGYLVTDFFSFCYILFLFSFFLACILLFCSCFLFLCNNACYALVL